MRKLYLCTLIVLSILAIASTNAFAVDSYEQYYAEPENDATAARDWAAPPVANWVIEGDTVLETWYDADFRAWRKALIHIPISGLAGRVLEPGSAHFWFFVWDANNLTVEALVDDPGPTPVWSEVNAARVWIGSVTATTEWVSFDVTDHLQGLINSGANYIGFLFSGGSGVIGSAEGNMAAHIEVPAEAPVPEPSSLLSLIAGVPIAALFRRKR